MTTLVLWALLASSPSLSAPVANQIPVSSTFHGRTLVDPYAWLKKKGDPAVEQALRAENEYSAQWLARTAPLRRQLYQEITARMPDTETSAPYPFNGYWYYDRAWPGLQHRVTYRKDMTQGQEQVLLDPNALAADGKFIAVAFQVVSDDNLKLAYAIDRTGFSDFTLLVKQLGSNEVLSERIVGVSSAAWAADSVTLFYTTEDAAKRSYRLYRHVLGAPVERDALVYEEKDERFSLSISRSRSRSVLMLEIDSLTTSEARYLDSRKPLSALRTVLKRKQDVQYSVEHRGDAFVVLTRDTSPQGRLVKVPMANSLQARPIELIPVRPDVALSAVHVFQDFYVVEEREHGLPRLRAVGFQNKKELKFTVPEEDFSLTGEENHEFKTNTFRYQYQSLVTPPTVFSVDMVSGQTQVLHVESVPTYDASKYETKRLFASASDGTQVPLSVVSRKGQVLDGLSPAVLQGYGAYGSSFDSSFSPNVASLLDRGVTLVIAHVRGGGEYGKKWHHAGRMMNKKNSFTDFIAAAEFLIAEGWTSSKRLGIRGGSAGGLLMGAVMNMRPDLFQAAVVEVPFVDVVNTMADKSLPLTVGEFEEWGNPANPQQFEYLLSYSPYDNVKAQAYPAILVRSAYNDAAVLFHEPAKWVSKLRTHNTSTKPLLLTMEMEPAGHSGVSGRYARAAQESKLLAFLLSQIQ
jgi:oligopeptidase B